MNDIKVTSIIDLKTYFGISVRLYFKLRVVVMMVIALSLVQYSLSADSHFDWSSEFILIGVFVGVYGLLMPFLLYRGCKAMITKIAYLAEDLDYAINADKIAYTGQTIMASSNWKYITKLVEREKYFLVMITARSFHYLPKSGFESAEEVARFKNIVREKGIKMAYH